MALDKLLSKNQLSKVLEKYLGNKEFDIKSHSVRLFSSQLDGQMSEQYILKIIYHLHKEEKVAQFFFKILRESNPVMYDISRSIYVYEKESFFYDTVVPLLKSKGLKVDYLPNSYFSEPFIIVLEDLTLRLFKGTPKGKPVDLKHCKKCLEVLAKFHAQPIIYELEKSKDLGRAYTLGEEFSDILEDKIFSKEENGATKFMHCSVKGVFDLIDLVPENGMNKSDFKIRLQAVLEQIMSSQGNSMGLRSTLSHGDLWSNNFLYCYSDNSDITDCVLVDFQTLKYGPPAFDVLQFILTNTRKAFREKHQTELLDYYYSFFTSLLAERGIQAAEVLSEEEFKKSCELLALPAKIQAVVESAASFMADEIHGNGPQNQEEFSKYLFEDRGKYMVTGFNQDKEYRALMIEEIIELRDMLFSE